MDEVPTPQTFNQARTAKAAERRKKLPGKWKYNPRAAEELLTKLYDGMSLREACKELQLDEKMVYHWAVRDIDGFAKRFGEARIARAMRWADEIMDIADDGTNDYVERETAKGRKFITLDSEAVLRSRLRIDTRKWMLARMLPRVYGDKVIHENEGIVEVHVKQIVLPAEAPATIDSLPTPPQKLLESSDSPV